MLIAFNKPYGVISQFTPDGSPNRRLADFGFPKNVYPIGRLDADSEGLLLLSDEAELNQRLLHPKQAHEREYWVQLERVPTSQALTELSRGVMVQGRARVIERGPRFRGLRRRLYAKYPQYPREAALGETDSVIVELTPTHVFSW